MDDVLKRLVENIVNKVFLDSEEERKRIRVYSNRINFSCPYCKDSKISPRKKRGNLYLDTLEYHCFNCGVHKNIYQLIKDYDLHFSRNIDILDSLKGKDFNKVVEVSSSLSESLVDERFLFSIDEIKAFYKFIDLTDSGAAYLTLRGGRLLHRKKEYFLSQEDNEGIVILNLDLRTNKVLSFSIRRFFGEKRYFLFSYKKIYETISPSFSLSEKDLEYYNNISSLFNILNISFGKYITIFEGQFDSLFMDNSISINGVSKSHDFIIKLNKLTNKVRVLFDNDKSGLNAERKLLESGVPVFLWKRFLSYYNVMDNNIKDLNDIYKYFSNNGIRFWEIKFDQFFSNDKLDLIYL